MTTHACHGRSKATTFEQRNKGVILLRSQILSSSWGGLSSNTSFSITRSDSSFLVCSPSDEPSSGSFVPSLSQVPPIYATIHGSGVYLVGLRGMWLSRLAISNSFFVKVSVCSRESFSFLNLLKINKNVVNIPKSRFPINVEFENYLAKKSKYDNINLI